MKPYIQSLILGIISATVLNSPFLLMYGVSLPEAFLAAIGSSILGTLGFMRSQAPFGVKHDNQTERIWIWSMFPNVFFLIIQAGVWMMLRSKSSDISVESDRIFAVVVGTAIAATLIWLITPMYMRKKRKRANQALVTTAMTQTPSTTSTAPLSHL